MADLTTILPAAVIAAVAGGMGNFAIQWMRTRGEAKVAATGAEVQLQQHQDKLTFQILGAAQAEIARLTAQVTDHAAMLIEVAHLAEALDHIRALLASRGNPEEARAAERRGTAFLNRMDRLLAARGDTRNETQLRESMERLAARGDGGEAAE